MRESSIDIDVYERSICSFLTHLLTCSLSLSTSLNSLSLYPSKTRNDVKSQTLSRFLSDKSSKCRSWSIMALHLSRHKRTCCRFHTDQPFIMQFISSNRSIGDDTRSWHRVPRKCVVVVHGLNISSCTWLSICTSLRALRKFVIHCHCKTPAKEKMPVKESKLNVPSDQERSSELKFDFYSIVTL